MGLNYHVNVPSGLQIILFGNRNKLKLYPSKVGNQLIESALENNQILPKPQLFDQSLQLVGIVE